MMCSECTCAEGEQLAQQTQQVEGHKTFREGSSGQQNLQQPHTQPAQELLQQIQTHNKPLGSLLANKKTQVGLCIAVCVYGTLYR